MESQGTPALAEKFYVDFPSRTSRSHLLIKVEVIRPDTLPETPQGFGEDL